MKEQFSGVVLNLKYFSVTVFLPLSCFWSMAYEGKIGLKNYDMLPYTDILQTWELKCTQLSLDSNAKVRRNTKGGEIASICLPDRNSFWMWVSFCPLWKQQMMKFPLGKWFESFQLTPWLSFFKNMFEKIAFLSSCLSVSLHRHILTLYSSNRAQSKRNRFLFQEFFNCRKVKYK